MTRAEHVQWCKERAIKEYDYYKDVKQGITSMMSDLTKHPETNSPTLQSLCLMQMMRPMNRQQFVNFINGFN